MTTTTGAWTVTRWPSLIHPTQRVKIIASRGEGRSRQVINVDLTNEAAAMFNPDHYWSTVAPACGENRGRWVCTTHAELFDNQMQKDIHVGNPHHAGPCVLAWVCNEHGAEQP